MGEREDDRDGWWEKGLLSTQNWWISYDFSGIEKISKQIQVFFLFSLYIFVLGYMNITEKIIKINKVMGQHTNI